MNDLFGEVGPSLPMLPWGVGGQPSQNPMMQQQVAQQVAALRNQMQQQEQMRYGMPGQQDPQVGAMMQELESRLGGGPQWRDTTGLGGRMSRLPMPQEQQAPQGPQQDPGMLLQALQLAARNSGTYDGGPGQMRDMDGVDARTLAQHGWPGASQGREVIDRNSSIPLSEEPWFDKYVAAGQAGAENMPMIKGGAATDSPEMLARRAEHRAARLQNERAGLLPMEERRANVRTNAINKSAARHGRMGIADNAPQMDLLRRLQGMEGSGDPMSGVSYLRNRMMGGPQFAGAAFDGAQKASLLDREMQGRAETEQMKLMYAAAISVLQNPLATPQEKQQAWQMIQGGQGGGMAMAPPVAEPAPSPFLPDRPVNEQPMKAWTQGGAKPVTLTDWLNALGGMEQTEIQDQMGKSWMSPWGLLPKGPRNSEMPALDYGY